MSTFAFPQLSIRNRVHSRKRTEIIGVREDPELIRIIIHTLLLACTLKTNLILLTLNKTPYYSSPTIIKKKKKKKKKTKTSLYNFDSLKPQFYIVKLWFTGVYIIFLFLLKHIDFGYSLEPHRRGGSNEYPQSMFLSRNMKNMKNIKLFIWKFSAFVGDFFYIFE